MWTFENFCILLNIFCSHFVSIGAFLSEYEPLVMTLGEMITMAPRPNVILSDMGRYCTQLDQLWGRGVFVGVSYSFCIPITTLHQLMLSIDWNRLKIRFIWSYLKLSVWLNLIFSYSPHVCVTACGYMWISQSESKCPGNHGLFNTFFPGRQASTFWFDL